MQRWMSNKHGAVPEPDAFEDLDDYSIGIVSENSVL